MATVIACSSRTMTIVLSHWNTVLQIRQHTTPSQYKYIGPVWRCVINWYRTSHMIRKIYTYFKANYDILQDIHVVVSSKILPCLHISEKKINIFKLNFFISD